MNTALNAWWQEHAAALDAVAAAQVRLTQAMASGDTLEAASNPYSEQMEDAIAHMRRRATELRSAVVLAHALPPAPDRAVREHLSTFLEVTTTGCDDFLRRRLGQMSDFDADAFEDMLIAFGRSVVRGNVELDLLNAALEAGNA